MNNRVGLSRHDRKFEILKRMAQRTQDGTPPQWLSVLEIAKSQGMKPSLHLRSLLRELAAGRHLLHREGEGRNHGIRDEYMLNLDAPVNADFASNWAEYQESFWS